MLISQVTSSDGTLMRVLLHTKERVVGRDIVPTFWQDLGGGKILQGAQNVERGTPPRLLPLLLQCVLIQALLLLLLLCLGLTILRRLLLQLLLLGLWVVGLLLLLLLLLQRLWIVGLLLLLLLLGWFPPREDKA